MRAEGAGRGVLPAVVALAAALSAAGCAEEPITGTDSGSAPGQTIDVLEVSVDAAEMATWRDTTFTGYGLPSQSGFFLMADEDTLQARSLVRVTGVSDTVRIDIDPFAVDSFVNAELRFLLDTSLSRGASGGFTLRLLALTRSYDPDEADWQEARSGEPWSDPGGDFGFELGRLQVDVVTDSVMSDTFAVPVSTATDSVMNAWADEDGEEGFGVLVEGPGTRLHVREMSFRWEARPEEMDTTLVQERARLAATAPTTFIYDPAPPPPGRKLRIAGLPASRFYLRFQPPDTVDGVALREGTINRAELVFPSLTPPAGFGTERALTGDILELAADPFELGPKTPVLRLLPSTNFLIDPDTLATGAAMAIPVTTLLQRWADTPPDSVAPFDLAVRAAPDWLAFGFWDFGSEESAPGQRPFLRVLVAPPVPFDLP